MLSSASRFKSFALLTLFSALAMGLSGCSNLKPREKAWQVWRPKKVDAPVINHPDVVYAPHLPNAMDSSDPDGFSSPLEFGELPSPPEPLSAEVAELSYEPMVEAPRQETVLQIPSLQTVNFAYDSAELDSGARTALDLNLEWLRENPSTYIQIEGHTDERGTVEYNLLLGERRAKTVKAYLTLRGIQDDHLYIISYGEERPVALTLDGDAFAKNRRAQFLAY